MATSSEDDNFGPFYQYLCGGGGLPVIPEEEHDEDNLDATDRRVLREHLVDHPEPEIYSPPPNESARLLVPYQGEDRGEIVKRWAKRAAFVVLVLLVGADIGLIAKNVFVSKKKFEAFKDPELSAEIGFLVLVGLVFAATLVYFCVKSCKRRSHEDIHVPHNVRGYGAIVV